MNEQKMLWLRGGILAVLLLFAAMVYLPEERGALLGQLGAADPFCEEGLLCIAYLDVGQGDASFIESPTGVQVLIDGGPNESVLRELSAVMGTFDRTIDIVVATHPDADHIGGLVDVLDRYQVSMIIMTENESDSAVAARFLERVTEEGAEIVYARRGQVYKLGNGSQFEILFPETNPKDMESNASSIVLKLMYGTTSALFTGDSPKRIEEYLVLAEGEHLKSDVLKVGHHGSRTSTSELFLAEVDPEYAVISAEKDSRYGHPHVEVTDLLFNYGVATKSTAEDGSVYLVSDGSVVTFQ